MLRQTLDRADGSRFKQPGGNKSVKMLCVFEVKKEIRVIVRSRRLHCLTVLGLLVGLSACGGGGGSSFGGPIPTGPTPSISSLSPSSVTAGDPGFTLTVNGSNFISGADVLWSNPDNPGFGHRYPRICEHIASDQTDLCRRHCHPGHGAGHCAQWRCSIERRSPSSLSPALQAELRRFRWVRMALHPTGTAMTLC